MGTDAHLHWHPFFRYPRAAREQAEPHGLTIDRAGNFRRLSAGTAFGGTGEVEEARVEEGKGRWAAAAAEFDQLSSAFCAFDNCVHDHAMYKYQHVGASYIIACPSIAAPFANIADPTDGLLHDGGEEASCMEVGARPAKSSAGATSKPGRESVVLKNSRMARLATELMAIAQQRQMSLKIGVHCGKCVGAVLGNLRSFYCIYGDTVNVASRLCQHADPNEIVVSPAFAASLPSLADLRYNKKLNLKGIGPFESYSIATPAAQAPMASSAGVHAWRAAMSRRRSSSESLPEV